MVELIVVMVMVGILSVYALPKMTAALSMRDDAWHDELISALRSAQKSAVARRRLTCVQINATTVKIMTSLANPAITCSTAVLGPDGNATFATSDDSSSAATVSPSPPDGVIYFQPDGRVTQDIAGATSYSPTVSMTGASSIVVYGETGYVQ